MISQGLAPTLIIVRVAYSQSVETVHLEPTSIQFADRECQNTRSGDTAQVLDYHSNTQSADKGSRIECGTVKTNEIREV